MRVLLWILVTIRKRSFSLYFWINVYETNQRIDNRGMTTWVKRAFGLLLLALLLSNCGSEEKEVLGKGSFEATEVLVSSEVNGKVLKWVAREGIMLEAGEEVGLIDTLQLFYQKRGSKTLSSRGKSDTSRCGETDSCPEGAIRGFEAAEGACGSSCGGWGIDTEGVRGS